MFMKFLTLNEAEYGDWAYYDNLQTGLVSKSLIVSSYLQVIGQELVQNA